MTVAAKKKVLIKKIPKSLTLTTTEESPELLSYKEDLADVRRRIDELMAVEDFLMMRVCELERSNPWD